MIFRELSVEELEAIWQIDRGEFIESIYRCSSGSLVEDTINLELAGWPPGDKDIYDPILKECFARGGYFLGAFDQGRLVGVVALGDRFLGKAQDQLQLKFMYVDRTCRKSGLGRKLFAMAVKEARRRGAKRLYVSSCESKNTVDFYRHMGCEMAREVDPELFELEPQDIHMEYEIPPEDRPESSMHYVAVAAFVCNEVGEVLLKRHPVRGWEFPGGRVEKGEDLIDALHREVFEETGFDIEVGQLIAIYSNKLSPGVVITFAAKATGGSPMTSGESLEVRWFDRGKALQVITHPVIRDQARDMLGFSGTVVYRAFAGEMASSSETAVYEIHRSTAL